MKSIQEYYGVSYKEAEQAYKDSKKVYVYYVYDNGALEYTCSSFEEADSKKGRGVIQKVWQNQAEYKAIQNKYLAEREFSITSWYNDLRAEYSNLNDKVFSLVYDYAYDRYHSEGYDAVANGMNDIETFASNIIEASKE